jgi:type VI secretion system protein VasD
VSVVVRRRSALLLPALLLARCAGPQPPLLDLTAIGGADQNPDTAGHPTSVAIRLFQLASSGTFESADVFALTERETETLGADDLGSEMFVLSPGERHVVQHGLKPGAAYVGAVALFRLIDRAAWRGVVPLAPHGTTKVLLTTTGIKLTLS